MISPEFVQRMASYNRWQNRSLYTAAAGLSDAERRRERGAFFGSIHATLNHILWADQVWMSRLADMPPPAVRRIPASTTIHEQWSALEGARRDYDEVIVRWADGLSPDALQGDLTWFSGSLGREVAKPRWLLVTHLFNHQTHHRGQVHGMLTAAGTWPEDTDLPFGPES